MRKKRKYREKRRMTFTANISSISVSVRKFINQEGKSLSLVFYQFIFPQSSSSRSLLYASSSFASSFLLSSLICLYLSLWHSLLIFHLLLSHFLNLFLCPLTRIDRSQNGIFHQSFFLSSGSSSVAFLNNAYFSLSSSSS